MSPEERIQLAKDIATAIEETHGMDESTHIKHHRILDELIDNMERKRMFWENVRKQVFGWGIIMILSGIGLAVWSAFNHLIHRT